MTYLSRKTHFSSAHRYFQPKFSEEKNREIFGKCYSEHGHGHNYFLEVTVGGNVNPLTGMVMNLVDIDHILLQVIEPLDHHHLNFDVPEFKEVVPTTENVARYCFDKIIKKLPTEVKLVRVRVYETENLWADIYG